MNRQILKSKATRVFGWSLLGIVVAWGLLTASVGIASGIISVVNPEEAQNVGLAVPPLLPPQAIKYSAVTHPGETQSPDGRSIAYLDPVPADIGSSISVFIPKSDGKSSEPEISFGMLSSIRYSGGGKIVLVTTTRPSVVASQTEMVLGNATTKMSDGTTAWVTTNLPDEISNQVVFLRAGLIITIAGNLPVESLQEFGSQVVISQR